MRVSQRIGHCQLRQGSGGKSKVNSDRENVSRSYTTAGADDQFFCFQAGRQDIDHRIHYCSPGINDRSTANLKYVRLGEHTEDWCLSRFLDFLIEKAFSHEHRSDVMAAIIHLSISSCVRNIFHAKAQRRRRKGAKKTLRNAVALCAFARV